MSNRQSEREHAQALLPFIPFGCMLFFDHATSSFDFISDLRGNDKGYFLFREAQ